jgi:Holliday junction resolvase RusA-like endonuclease
LKRTFFYPCHPRGQGRPRFAGKVAYKSSEDRAYENAILGAYRAAYPSAETIEGPFNIRVVAGYPIPKGASKAAKAAMLEGITPPTVRPDIDNVIKAVMDALNGVAFSDDKNAIWIYGQKIYAERPGLFVEIWKGEAE